MTRVSVSTRTPSKVTVSESLEDAELKLPKRSSLNIILLTNALLQITFFIIVSSSNEYAQHLGGTSTFSGVVIGIPTVFSGLTLIPLMKYDRGGYTLPLHICCLFSILGLVLYASAYKANWLYLILIGRITNGIAFSMWMYCKRFCSDPRIVGVRRRTTLASWLVVGNGVGMGLGPLLGGLFYRYIGFGKGTGGVWNGFTSPAWVMAGVWAIFWVVVILWFEDVKDNPTQLQPTSAIALTEPVNADTDTNENSSGVSAHLHDNTANPTPSLNLRHANTIPAPAPSSPESSLPIPEPEKHHISLAQWGVIFCMCWFAMTSFFILGAWEANIPVYSSSNPHLSFTPFAAGNFLALGALACFPFFILNLFLARKVQDRYILVVGSGVGLSALIVFLALLASNRVNIGGTSAKGVSVVGAPAAPIFFICWFLTALGFNIASTTTFALLSKHLPPTPSYNTLSSLMIQYSNYTGRVCGAVWGGAGVSVGMEKYVGLEIAFVGFGLMVCRGFWRELKAKTG